MTGKTKGLICGAAMVAGVILAIYGLAARDGETGGYTLPITGVALFVAGWIMLQIWTPSKRND